MAGHRSTSCSRWHASPEAAKYAAHHTRLSSRSSVRTTPSLKTSIVTSSAARSISPGSSGNAGWQRLVRPSNARHDGGAIQGIAESAVGAAHPHSGSSASFARRPSDRLRDPMGVTSTSFERRRIRTSTGSNARFSTTATTRNLASGPSSWMTTSAGWPGSAVHVSPSAGSRNRVLKWCRRPATERERVSHRRPGNQQHGHRPRPSEHPKIASPKATCSTSPFHTATTSSSASTSSSTSTRTVFTCTSRS